MLVESFVALTSLASFTAATDVLPVVRAKMTEQVTQFSDAALAILDAMRHDPDATYSYEHLSGGFYWSDEFPPFDSADWKVVGHDYIYRYLIRIRRCITLGDTALESSPLWQQVSSLAPNWPGLLPERRSGRIVRRLRAAERMADRCLEKLEAKFDEAGDA